MSKSEGLLITVAIVGMLGVFALVSRMNADLGGSVEPFGMFAYALGGLMSLLVGGGLFFLVFYSARHGYDDIDRTDDDT